MKKRLARRLGIVLAVLLFGGWFAFSTFLFSPIEGDLEADVSTLVPNRIDFFVAKARLNRDFDGFPRLRVQSELERTKAWRAWERSPEYDELMTERGVKAALDELAQELDALPSLPGLGIPAVFGGRDLALAGRFAGSGLQTSDWVAYGRVNFWGKLAASLLRHPGPLGLEKQGLQVADEGDVISIAGGRLSRPLYLARERDVVALGTAKDMVQAMHDLALRGGQESFGQSARYHDDIAQSRLRDDGDELELFVDVRSLLETAKIGGRWPDPSSQDFLPAFLGRLFQVGSVNEVVGLADFKGGFQLDLRGELSSELITPVQSRLYRVAGFEQRELFDAARLARADSSLFVFAKTDLGELLTQIMESLEPAARDLIEDSLRSTGKYQDAQQLIEEIDEIFRDRVAIIMRPNDFQYKYDGPIEEQDPPNDGMPVPAVAVVLWTVDDEKARQRIEDFHNLIVQNQGKLGIEGHEPGSRGVFHNPIFGGNVLWEFWHKNIPGTGHLAATQSVDVYVVANSYRMVENVLRTYYFGEPADPRLADLPQFQALATSSLPVANVAAWVNPERLAVTRREQADLLARDAVLDSIDWSVERPKMERAVLQEDFGGRGRAQLQPGEQQELDVVVSERLDQLQEQLLEERVPKVRAETERAILYSELCSGLLAMMDLDPRSVRFSLRAMIPLKE